MKETRRTILVATAAAAVLQVVNYSFPTPPVDLGIAPLAAAAVAAIARR